MNTEANVAAKWWADQLRDGVKHDAGDPLINAFHSMARSKAFAPTPEQIDDFEAILASIIQQTMIDSEMWREAMRRNIPNFGGAFRNLSVDYGACDELRAASQMAGFPIKGLEVFPIKTNMQINPGSVVVARGYRAPFVELMEAGGSPTDEPKDVKVL